MIVKLITQISDFYYKGCKWGDILEKPDVALQSWVLSKNYLTEHQSLADYYTKSEIENKGYLTQHQSLANYAKKSDIPSLSGYATQSWVEGKGYLTEHQSLSDYAKKSELPSLTGYATQSWVEGKGYLTEHQSLADYYTKSDIDSKGYLTEHQSLSDYAKKSDIPSLSGYYTKTEIDNKGYLTEHQSLADYYTKEEIDETYSDVAFWDDVKYRVGETCEIPGDLRFNEVVSETYDRRTGNITNKKCSYVYFPLSKLRAVDNTLTLNLNGTNYMLAFSGGDILYSMDGRKFTDLCIDGKIVTSCIASFGFFIIDDEFVINCPDGSEFTITTTSEIGKYLRTISTVNRLSIMTSEGEKEIARQDWVIDNINELCNDYLLDYYTKYDIDEMIGNVETNINNIAG